MQHAHAHEGPANVSAQEFVGIAPTAFAVSTSTRADFHTRRVGINYRF